jgi:acyl-CoA thioester hydrolase
LIPLCSYRVYYEDTDAGGIVYHANYLKFCERARSDYFFNHGTSPQRGDNHFVIASMQAKFKASAKLGDTIEVSLSVNSISKSSFDLHQEVSRDGKVLFEMDGKFVLTNPEGRIVRLSEEDLKLFT